MIDITKFDGHTAGPWFFANSGRYKVASIAACGVYADVMPADCVTQDARLIAAAPDLLAEVIRLQAALTAVDRQLGHDDADDALRKDAERYRWLREQHWSTGLLAVAEDPKHAIKLGFDCPSLDRLDAVIDAALLAKRAIGAA